MSSRKRIGANMHASKSLSTNLGHEKADTIPIISLADNAVSSSAFR